MLAANRPRFRAAGTRCLKLGLEEAMAMAASTLCSGFIGGRTIEKLRPRMPKPARRFRPPVESSKKSKAAKKAMESPSDSFRTASLPLLDEFTDWQSSSRLASSSSEKPIDADTEESRGQMSLEEFLNTQVGAPSIQVAPENVKTVQITGDYSLRKKKKEKKPKKIEELNERAESWKPAEVDSLASDDERVEVWEGDMGPMTEEEEAQLLAQAEQELAELKSKHGELPDFLPEKDDEGSDAEGPGTARSTRSTVPAVMRCFDRAKIYVKAGDGGNGEVAFRREKFVPFGGPSGGNGGRGGNVYVEVDNSLNSLLSFRKCVHFRAERGQHGLGKSQDGAFGKDCVVKVPPGTLVREICDEPGDGKVLLELVKPGQRELLLPGGRGGRGNASFKSDRNKAPQLAEKGEQGPEMWIELELKLVADAGIIGVPNAGKSTLLSAVSAARPEIAAYPFTTLLPNLGVVALDYDATMVVADLPGLLEGAHTGYGLGHEFLRHTERCRVLIHVVDGMSAQPEYEYEAVRLELQLFNPALSSKACVIAYNKMDIPEAAERWPRFKKAMEAHGLKPYCMSAATTEGTSEVVRAAFELLKTADNLIEAEVAHNNVQVAQMVKKERSAPIGEFSISNDPGSKLWYIEGAGLERFVQMTNWDYFESMQRFERILECSGVNEQLKSRGVKEEDRVIIGDKEFTWHESRNLSKDIVNVGQWKRNPRGSKHWPH